LLQFFDNTFNIYSDLLPPPPSTWKDGKAASAKYMTKLKMQEKQTKKYLIKVYKGSRKKSSYLNGLAINAYPPPPSRAYWPLE